MGEHIAQTGLRLSAPEAGDIVTVHVKSAPRPQMVGGLAAGLRTEVVDNAKNPDNYRMTTIFKVIAVNGGQAVVERLTGYSIGTREVWPIHLHEWFEAGELYEALRIDTSPAQTDAGDGANPADPPSD